MKLLFGIHSLNFGGVHSLKLTVQPLKIGLKIHRSIIDLSVVFAVSFREGSSAKMFGRTSIEENGGVKNQVYNLSFMLSGEELYEFRREKNKANPCLTNTFPRPIISCIYVQFP